MAGTDENFAADLSAFRIDAGAGMVAPVFFVTVFTAEGWLRPGYDQASMFVSELSIGPRGWVQVINFFVTGGLLLRFVRGAAAHFAPGRASRAGPILLRIIGCSLIGSGLFVTDPSALFAQSSIHGYIHGLFGAVVFSLAPASCFVYFTCFRQDPAWRSLAPWTLSAGTIVTVGIIFLKVSQLPGSDLSSLKGLIQRGILIVFMAWVYVFSRRLSGLSDNDRSLRR